jgi:hypothetical protein
VSLILAWVLFPLVLAAIGLGWGVIVERAGALRLNDALLLPSGLAAALVVAGTLTAFSATAPAAVTVVAVGGATGLVFAWRWRRRPGGWALLAAVGVLLAYGAPVLLSGHATFTGYVKLDDTATSLNWIDNLMSHGRSVAGLPASTYRLEFEQANPVYPLGAFMLPGLARALTGVDMAWVFQPYLACCGAALALCLYALMEPVIASVRIRALLAFTGAQPALLYGYSLWGGIKEMTAAFLLALGVALAAGILLRPPVRWRELLPVAIAAGALIQTLGAGAAAWVVPALVLVAVSWLLRERRARGLRAAAAPTAWLAALGALMVVPVWVVLSDFFSNRANMLSQLFSSGQSVHTKLGNLIQPLSAWQLAGIWPTGDFRVTAPTLQSALWIGLALLAAAGALFFSVRKGRYGVAFYVAVALIGCAIVYYSGGTPWVTAKALAVSSPALIAAALTGAGMLWGRSRFGGVLLAVALIGGVLWSNVLGYHEVTLAPYGRLVELQHIGRLVAGKGPTFMNEYEVYADRHFLREGAPVEPAEYREPSLPLRNGSILTKDGAANLDAFPLSTLLPYRSIVVRRSPVESRPPSIYHLVWQGRYYELWQRAEEPAQTILEHVPYGDSNTLVYCGQAQRGEAEPLCAIQPVTVNPSCPQIRGFGRQALREKAHLVAYQRPAPIVVRADQSLWPASWVHSPAEQTLTATKPATLVAHIAVASPQSYELWLGGSFARGFVVSADGERVGAVKDQLSSLDGYVHIGDLFLAPGVHTFAITYPHADLTPGSGADGYTTLSAIALQPRERPASELIEVPGNQASALCGRPLDWIELVRG